MTESEKEEKKSTRKKRRGRRPIPHHSLEDALSVAEAIQNGNNGRPWKPLFIADHVGMSKTSSRFRNLTSSAYKYGIVTGTWNASEIGLTETGSLLTRPTSQEEKIEARQKAVLNVEIFENVYNHYEGGKLPSSEDQYFRNALESEFGLDQQYMDEFLVQLVANGRFAVILYQSQGSEWVTFERNAAQTSNNRETNGMSYASLPAAGAEEELDAPVAKPEAATQANQIFIIHGKNRNPLEQVKNILEEFKIPHKVAVDEPHSGRPISQKVGQLMKECTSAIVIFTADEVYQDEEGNDIRRPSDNAVYELGAASILYGNKVVILKENGVGLGSDFKDLGYISFDEGNLASKAMDLIKELVGFGFLKITPT